MSSFYIIPGECLLVFSLPTLSVCTHQNNYLSQYSCIVINFSMPVPVENLEDLVIVIKEMIDRMNSKLESKIDNMSERLNLVLDNINNKFDRMNLVLASITNNLENI